MKKRGSLRFLFLSIFLNALILTIPSQAQPPWKDTFIPSEAGGEQGIAVRVIPPPFARYAQGSPVVIYVQGGTLGEGINNAKLRLEKKGLSRFYSIFPAAARMPTEAVALMISEGRNV